MTVLRQSEWEDLDGFQIDWAQFCISYDLGCDIVDAFSRPLQEACEAEDRLTVVAIVWFMLLATGLPLPSRTFACRCDLLGVRSLIRSLSFEARCGEVDDLHEVLTETARAAGIYGPHAWWPTPRHREAATDRPAWAIGPSKN